MLFAVLLLSLTSSLSQSGRYDESARERDERVSDLFQELNLSKGMCVADIGFGDGFFAVRLARRVGETGRALCVEIDKQLVGQLKDRVRREKLNNVEVILGSPDKVNLPKATLDAALTAYAYHEMQQPEAMLKEIWQALKPGSVLLVLDQSRMENRFKSRAAQLATHEISPDLVESELRKIGYEIVDRKDSCILRPKDGSHTLVGYVITARRPGMSK
jgi:ubiquinone/menaquinone biosynthesis C-methylase UbiE